MLDFIAAQGHIRRQGDVGVSGEGARLARRLASPSDAFQDRHRDLDLIAVASPTGPVMALANLAESPLAQLVRRKGRDGKPFLSDREFQVFRLMGEGHSTKEISKLLEISTKTVDSHRENMKAKLGCTNSTELLLQARDWLGVANGNSRGTK